MADQESLSADFNKRDNFVGYYIFQSTKDLISDSFIREINDFLISKCHIDQYIWQCDSFYLKQISETPQLPAHLYGSTYYGDNREDEWYIVYLLMELSKKYEDIIVRVIDEDGEFLLIEVADDIPPWLHPEIEENRVFIHRGGVHILECDCTQGTLPIRTALSYIKSHPNETLASMKIQGDISDNIKGYPGKISDLKHHANCYIPANLSALLDSNPSFIAHIVCAFYERDSNDLKNCVTFKYFQPGTRVMRRVQMTRCLYAQLMKQSFNPDPRSGFILPHVNSQKFKAHDLGAKLAFGAEIICRTGCEGFQNKKFVSKATGSNDISEKCSFPDLLVKGHVERDCAGNVMLSCLKNLRVDIERLRKEAENLESSDDDSWIDKIHVELEDRLNKHFDKSMGAEETIEKLPEKIKSFINQKSSYLGVESLESGDNEISFEPGKFLKSFQKLFDFEDPKNSSSDSELDEYDSESDLDEEGMISTEKEFKNLMTRMDKELSAAGVRKSFISKNNMDASKDAKSTHKTSWATWGKKNKTDFSRSDSPSCTTRKGALQTNDEVDSDGDCESDSDFKPVDIDINLVQNFLKSFNAQQGAPGPSSVIMNSLGLNLPPLDSDDDDDDANAS